VTGTWYVRFTSLETVWWMRWYPRMAMSEALDALGGRSGHERRACRSEAQAGNARVHYKPCRKHCMEDQVIPVHPTPARFAETPGCPGRYILTATFINKGKTIQYYVNGVQVAAVTNAGAGTISSWSQCILGRGQNTGQVHLKGYMKVSGCEIPLRCHI
jgi:hypothetical protein